MAGVSVLATAHCPAVRAQEPRSEQIPKTDASIVVRTTENIVEGNWVWLLNAARDSSIRRIYLLVKQDENNFESARTGRNLRSGELLVPLPGEKTAEGWDNMEWLTEFLSRAKSFDIEVHAWWPCFQDAIASEKFPHARYKGDQEDVFVDPAYAEIRDRQKNLLAALLNLYPFDGVALDWIRYSSLKDGANGPLGQRFEVVTGRKWSTEAMADPFLQAMWNDLRARKTADWVEDLLGELRPSHPTVSWSAFVLPWMFKDVAQSYRHLSAAGLDALQPMIYWKDWNEKPEFTSEVVSPAPFFLTGRTTLAPTIDITGDLAEIEAALDYLPHDRLGHITWYHHREWTSDDFTKVSAIHAAFQNARAELYGEETSTPQHQPLASRLERAAFPPDASMWSLVCLAELHQRNALEDAEPVIPVLGFHRFNEGPLESGPDVWYNSTAYIDALLEFLKNQQFAVIPAAQAAAYVTSENRDALPSRPLVLIIDDGSGTIVQHFEPRAAKANIPYSVALVTEWVKENDGQEIDLGGGLKDTVLTWQEVKSLSDTGRVGFMSHTHAQHRYAASGRSGTEAAPAITSRLWIASEQRQETETERLSRIGDDLAQSRAVLELYTGKQSTFLAWPYGMHDDAAENVAKELGYTHFFEFGGHTIAAPKLKPHRIMRLGVMSPDEVVPLKFPDDPWVQQRWWLTFLRWARATMSIDLMEAALLQLESEQRDHPEAVITRAAQFLLNGHATLCFRQLTVLRNIYPHDATVHSSVDEFEAVYQGLV